VLNNNNWYVQSGRIISNAAQQQNLAACQVYVQNGWTTGGGQQAGVVNGQDWATFSAAQSKIWWQTHA